MKLFGSITSPFVRKVRMAAAELEIALTFELIDVREPNETLNQIAPVGKIPVLRLQYGATIFESDLIVRYFESTKAHTSLFPEKFDLQFEQHLALVNSSMDTAAQIIMESWRASSPDNKKALDKLKERLSRCMTALNREADLVNNNTDYRWIAMASLLGYLDFRNQLPNWKELVPNLLPWFDEISSSASFQETAPHQSN